MAVREKEVYFSRFHEYNANKYPRSAGYVQSKDPAGTGSGNHQGLAIIRVWLASKSDSKVYGWKTGETAEIRNINT
ncbi:hypothetical protein L21SP2_2811 [Salinispira pacifica]|uniref:Uncharacterized protein n=1 Tax=Salinispira pacifica TaxID=1307761 RepID=V5WM37_9SPIO|nr:hypothetical protein L21SP2_2811 [Salinispira pacifica]